MRHADARGWTIWDKLVIRMAWLAFHWSGEYWFGPLYWLSRGRILAYKSNIWLNLAAAAWLIDDLKRKDLPPRDAWPG